MKENNPGWQKAEPVERVYANYDPKNNLPTHEAILPNHKYKEVEALEVLFLSLTRLTKHSLLHIKSYYDRTSDCNILGSNM